MPKPQGSVAGYGTFAGDDLTYTVWRNGNLMRQATWGHAQFSQFSFQDFPWVLDALQHLTYCLLEQTNRR